MKGKKIEIIPLATRKIKKRHIKKNLVVETLHEPDQIVPGYGDCKVAPKIYRIKKKEYLLRVVYEEQEDLLLVITAYLTSKVSGYWKGSK
ncbi:MAG: hypothetical protein GWN01_13745 [Nitrosopumilaceae archaeon]|nr:hypothetical protein [Nitrosopumilaceae archaeon]NIU88877.1 hypothetical protein [Nitrosopumilaceae archaeon]NIV66997.1 hypothetical protein [Nitrosopumilaceae archaeon]NIX62529.1 hypothetical protein [Nitrosopumilaceae archaeon]